MGNESQGSSLVVAMLVARNVLYLLSCDTTNQCTVRQLHSDAGRITRFWRPALEKVHDGVGMSFGRRESRLVAAAQIP